MEIRALPPLLPPGTHHVERAILQPQALDNAASAARRHTLPLRGLPLQFRQLPPLQGTLQLASSDSHGGCGAAGRQWGSSGATGSRKHARASEIKKVPSDPVKQLVPRRHARPEPGIRKRRDVGPFAPRSRFCPAADQRSVRVRKSFSDRSTLLDAAFRSPAARANLATGSRNRVNAPGLRLQSDPEACPSPFGFTLPFPSGLLLPAGIRSASEARCRGLKPVAGSTSGLPACLRAATPLQGISTPRDQSAQPDSIQECLPSRVARSSFAPRLAKIFNDRRAMDQRSRSATSRQAHCSSNLLEPSS
jgi:hypothetical protein